jgi:glycyl-tRNA synthetase alpha chain
MPAPDQRFQSVQTVQDLILALSSYWASRDCVLAQPYDIEKGAGTMNPETFLRVLGPEPYRVAYVEPSRRPKDGRYGDNPFRVEKHHQFQVMLKPSPDDVVELYLDSLRALGIEAKLHDLKLEEDNWESPTLGAMGVGWQVNLDGMEISQFTYFQQAGGLELKPVSAEITYGIERIVMFLTGKNDIFDLGWSPDVTVGDLRRDAEVEFSRYNFELADVAMLGKVFEMNEAEAMRLLGLGSVLPAYDCCLKLSHAFNVLDARGAIGVSERQGYIARVRKVACRVAEAYLKSREAKGFPLLGRWGAGEPAR